MSKKNSSNNSSRFKQQEFGQHLPTQRWRWEATLKFEQIFRQRWLDQTTLNKNIKIECHTMKSPKETKTSQLNWSQNEGEWERVHGFLASNLASWLPTSHVASLWRAGHGRDRQRETFGNIQSIRSLLCIVIDNHQYDSTKLYIGPWVEVDNQGGDDHPLQWA